MLLHTDLTSATDGTMILRKDMFDDVSLSMGSDNDIAFHKPVIKSQVENLTGNKLGKLFVKAAAQKAKPVLLEPVMKVEAVTPKDYLGDVTGDLNRRRGIVLGMVESVTGNIVRAEVPLAEMFGYATDLRSMSQGRATYTMEFEKYVEIPNNIAEGLIQKAS